MEKEIKIEMSCTILDEPCFHLHEFWQCCICFKDWIQKGRTTISQIISEYNQAIKEERYKDE